MNEYMLLMHDDVTHLADSEDGAMWGSYLSKLRRSGQLDGGSSIGNGESLRLGHPTVTADTTITGFMRIRAKDLAEAKCFLKGNPVYEAGGTVQIRELTQD